jgi:hypothetical protein
MACLWPPKARSFKRSCGPKSGTWSRSLGARTVLVGYIVERQGLMLAVVGLTVAVEPR